jgi:hypothetical protein
MSLNGHQFVDRYTGWPVVIMVTTGFDVTKFLTLCEDYGVTVSQLHLRQGGRTSLPRWWRT